MLKVNEHSGEEHIIEASNLGICYRQYREKTVTLKDFVVNLFSGSKFKEFWALRNLDLNVRRGEHLGLIGANGCGKSTLLKAIASVLPAREGNISVHGMVTPLIELGAGFNAELTGRENIFLNGAIMGLSRQNMQERFDRIVDFAELEEHIDIPIRNYSSGMRTRLGFSVAADIEPEILLLDEIFAVGDESFKLKCQVRMQEIFDKGVTVIMVSHSLPLIAEYCERVIFMDKGQIVADGPTDEVIKRYKEHVSMQKKQAS
ncbi:MAG: teichoic acid ABC transporter ATP-binding protein [Myxococcales bacterium]|nr:teichoic acid ABC transporter ATP-binding protein [Myxococcales bacterium]|tara:strand:- start:70 stop:849 length:780 start_codon:yes stop_codon:yes gene_type:complete